jgi:hypothetical protein
MYIIGVVARLKNTLPAKEAEMRKTLLFIFVVLVLVASSFVSGGAYAASLKNAKLTRGQGYTIDQLTKDYYSLKDTNCGKAGYELCETLGHFGEYLIDQSGRESIKGMFKAADGLWHVTHPWDVYHFSATSACYSYETVAWHQSGSCPIGTTNSLCNDYIARPGYVYNWNPDGKWQVGVIPLVAGYYAAGSPKGTLYCKVQQ